MNSAHTAMFIKMFNVGESWNQRDRFRESYLGFDAPAPMQPLPKDHKPPNQDGTLKSRPVVLGCESNTVGGMEIITNILTGYLQSIPHQDRVGVTSTN